MLDVSKMMCHKKSDTCVFLGSGQSINSITKEQWNVIRRCDSWTVNNWIYHPSFVPDFYHVEVKYYNYRLIQRRLDEKKEQYRNTKFIFPRGKMVKLEGTRLPLHKVIPDICEKFDYETKARDRHRTHKVFSAKYKIVTGCLVKSYDMTITAIFELLYKFGYRRIVTFGIDLYNSYYFWTGGDSKYGEVHHQTNKSHENKSPDQPHGTYKIRDFLIDFNRRWMVPNGRRIFIGHKNTALYPYLRYLDLGNLK